MRRSELKLQTLEISNNKIMNFKINGKWPKLVSQENKAIDIHTRNYK